MKKIIFIAISTVFLSVTILLPVHQVSAVDIFDRGVCNNGKARGATVCEEKNQRGNPISGPQGVLTFVINFLTAVVGIAAVIMIILGGLKYVTSGSNSDDAKNARERIIYAMIALLVAGIAQLAVRFILQVVVNRG